MSDGLHGRQDALWGRVLACLGDGHWHALASCRVSCGVGAPVLRRALRDYARRGAPLQFDGARGVRLRAPVTPLASRRVRIRAVTCFETDSTNAQLLQALKQGVSHPVALAAEQQTRGRGRHERRWLTPLGGGIALSLAWPYALLPGGRPPSALSLRIGVALAQACARLGVRNVRLKWPNDLLVDGRKLGGVLVEGGAMGVVIGVGLNHAFPRGWKSRVGQPLTSLSDSLGRRVPPRSRVLNVVLDALLAEMGSDDEAWRDRFARRDALAGRPVRVSGGGGEVWEGVANGVTRDGALRVITPGGERLCHAGEVSVRLGG
ncbi:MAG: biotin--[acetyl-CoA-carboxylase] ligase [Halothiobacillaceae bacterium]